MEKDITWNIRRLVNKSFLPANQCFILQFVGRLYNWQPLMANFPKVLTSSVFEKVLSTNPSWLFNHMTKFSKQSVRLFIYGTIFALCLNFIEEVSKCVLQTTWILILKYTSISCWVTNTASVFCIDINIAVHFIY